MQRLDVRYCLYMSILSNLCHVSYDKRPVGLCTSLHTYAASLLRLDTQSANDGRSAHLSSNRRRSHSPGHRLTSELQGTRAKIVPLWFCAKLLCIFEVVCAMKQLTKIYEKYQATCFNLSHHGLLPPLVAAIQARGQPLSLDHFCCLRNKQHAKSL